MALVFSRKDADDQGRFKEAEDLASRTAPQLQCEVMLFEGNQALKKGQSAANDQKLKREQYALAEQAYRQALKGAHQYQDPFIESGAFIGLSVVTTRLGRFDEAIDWSTRSLDFARLQRSRGAENVAVSNLAWSYAELGDLEKAISNSEALQIDSLGQEQLKQTVLSNLGDIYAARGNFSGARETYLKAFDVAKGMERKTGTDEKYHEALFLSNVAAVDLEEGRLDDAEKYSRQALATRPDVRRAKLIFAKIAAAKYHLSEARTLLQELVGGKGVFDDDFVRWDAEAELANIAAMEHQNSRAENEFRNLIYQVEAARSALRVDENRLAFSFHAGRYYDDYVRFLIDTGQERKAFQVAEFSRARTLEEGVGMKAPVRSSDISISAVQNFLRLHNKTILAYWLARKKSYLWLVSASQFKTFTLVEESKIEPEVDSYNKILVNSGTVEDLEQVGQSLYRKLVAPAQGYLRHNAGVVIIPDGRLNQLNFETLRVPQPSPHYWIEDVEAQIADSTALLIRSKRDVWSRTPRLLVMGDPMEGGKPALPHGAEEIRRVEAHFPEDHEREVSGAGATPSAYKANHPEKYDLIHIVAHGSASELSPLESALILSSEGENSSKLYAREIVKTHLNADLVTISACGGAGKRAYSGEGLVGLAWAFLKAGAHRVVAGLWEVDDRAAVDLTDDFYTELQKRTPTSAALRAAKLKMVHSTRIYRLPYYWGSLQLYMGS